MKGTLTIILTFLTLIAFSQNKIYKFSSISENEGDTAYGHQMISWDLSRIGQYRKALINWDKDFSQDNKPLEKDSLTFLNFIPHNAHDYILSQVDSFQVVMINEAHHSSLHRNFTSSLLKELYNKGFRYIGLEALSRKDTINERGYPNQYSGYYISEPEFGNLVRTALKLGYFVFGYDTFGLQGMEREIEQAKNIQKILEKDPHAKILIHAGFGHIREDEDIKDWKKAMAGRLKEFTGIDPLTIDQTEMSERSDKKFENPYYRIASIKEPTIFINKENQIFIDKSLKKKFDIQVFHPKTEYKKDRPDWLYTNEKQFYPISLNDTSITFPIMVFAFLQNEYIHEKKGNLIPVDIIEVQSRAESTGLVLKKGQYVLIFKDRLGKTEEEQIEIK